MSEDTATKVCPLCAETIKAAAKICPHCRKKQGGGFHISPYPVIALASMASLLLFVILASEFFPHGRYFFPRRDRIDTLKCHAAIHTGLYSTNVIVAGVLTNMSEYAWIIDEYEVRFKDDKQIVWADRGYANDRFVILPHAIEAFKFHLDLNSIPKHNSLEVRVRDAHDPRSWFEIN